MKLFIPELKELLSLNKDWKFSLHQERRNESVIKKYLSKESKEREEHISKEVSPFITKGLFEKSYFECSKDERELRNLAAKIRMEIESTPFEMVIKKGEILEVDRIYIRKGAEDYSSVTFKWIVDGKTLRFWVKLEDANNLNVSQEGKLDRWPEGRLSLTIDGTKHLLCRANNHYNFFGVKIGESGSLEKLNWQDKYKSYCGEINDLDKLIALAKKRDYPQNLIEAFIERHKKYMQDKK